MEMLAASVLDKDVHARLLEDIDSVAAHARVPVHMIHKSAKAVLVDSVIEWLLDIRKHHQKNCFGLVLVGKYSVSIETQFMAMAAVLLRNFIDAQVIPLADLLIEGQPNPTVLLIPNFHIAYSGKPLTSWQLQILHSMLLRRVVEGKQTVVYVESMELLEKQYGAAICSLLKNYRAISE